MEKVFDKNQRIGEIASTFPKATDVFMKYDIDFCCGGDRVLGDVMKAQGLNEDEVMLEINKLYEEFKSTDDKEVDWRVEPMSDLIDYVVNKHHAFLKAELPITGEFISKILQVHYVDHGTVLSKLNKLFNNLKTELEEHLIKEEAALFPLIKEYEKDKSQETLDKALKVMEETESEHDNAGDILKEMRKITEQYMVPQNGCTTFAKTYEKLEAIEKDLFRHIHLENNILFERLKKEKK